MVEYFIQKALKNHREGRVHRYVARTVGSSGFNKDGTIKREALNEAEETARRNHDVSEERAIVLAKRLQDYAKERERG